MTVLIFRSTIRSVPDGLAWCLRLRRARAIYFPPDGAMLLLRGS
jgi:hypothetical protein